MFAFGTSPRAIFDGAALLTQEGVAIARNFKRHHYYIIESLDKSFSHAESFMVNAVNLCCDCRLKFPVRMPCEASLNR